MENWFIDETKQKGFSFIVVSIDDANIGRVRSEMNKLPRNRQRALHFYHETPQTRSSALRLIAELPVKVLLINAPKAMNAAKPRERAVAAVISKALDLKPRRIVFEMDEANLTNDRRLLSNGLRREHGVEYQHLGRTTEALLWIPDGLAWTYNRGGHLWDLVKHLVVETINV